MVFLVTNYPVPPMPCIYMGEDRASNIVLFNLPLQLGIIYTHTQVECEIIWTARNAVFFYVAGYLIEERRRRPVITASHEDNVLNKFRILKERHVQMRIPYYQSPGRMKNSSYYIAPVGD